MDYPARHFVGTPDLVKDAVRKGMARAGVTSLDWRMCLEAIARYETDCDPTPPVGVCKDCRGMMQCSTGMYTSAYDHGFIDHISYGSPVQAVYVAILYIQGKLPGYGGYGGVQGLLKRHDRGPGDLLRVWCNHPAYGFETLRDDYCGY